MTQDDIERIDDDLHDAWMDLGRVKFENGRLKVSGHVERPYRLGLIPRLARFEFVLTVAGVTTFRVDDDDGVEIVPVERVHYDKNSST